MKNIGSSITAQPYSVVISGDTNSESVA